jgi:hypothetical protein
MRDESATAAGVRSDVGAEAFDVAHAFAMGDAVRIPDRGAATANGIFFQLFDIQFAGFVSNRLYVFGHRAG